MKKKMNLTESTILALQGKLQEDVIQNYKTVVKNRNDNQFAADEHKKSRDKWLDVDEYSAKEHKKSRDHFQKEANRFEDERKDILRKAREKRQAKIEAKEINEYVDCEMKKLMDKKYESKNFKKLNEDKEFFGYSIKDDLEEYNGPVSYDNFYERAIDNNVEEEAFEKYGSRSKTNVEKVIREYYKQYKEAFKDMPKVPTDKNLKDQMNDFIEDIGASKTSNITRSNGVYSGKVKFSEDRIGELIYNSSENHPYILYTGKGYEHISADTLDELKDKYRDLK